MRVDRDLQREMLELMSLHYPERVNRPFSEFTKEYEPAHVWANATYLMESGFLDFDGREGVVLRGKITTEGIDFLQDDGGISAARRVMTVKIHDESIKKLLDGIIAKADIPEEKKATLRGKVAKLGADGLKKVTDKLLGMGADKAIELGRDAVEVLMEAI